MHNAFAALTLVCCAALPAHAAIDGTALVVVGGYTGIALLPVTADGPGEVMPVLRPGTFAQDGASITGPCFSPDGSRLAFSRRALDGPQGSWRQMIYTVSPDGSGLDSICLAENPKCLQLCLSWTSDGCLYWSEETRSVFRADLSSRTRETVGSLSDFSGPKPLPLQVDAIKMSLDGTRGGFMVYNVGWCMGLDFTKWTSTSYGVGCQATVSPNGGLVTHSSTMPGYQFHQVGFIRDFETTTIVDTFLAPGAVPGDTGALPRINFFRFSHSSDGHITFRGEDALDGNAYIHDLLSNETVNIGDVIPFDFRPSSAPGPTGAHVVLDTDELRFASPDGSTPPPRTVTLITDGSVPEHVRVTIEPSTATWLRTERAAAELTVSVDPSALPPGSHHARIGVSGGPADDGDVCTVVFDVNTPIPAPTYLRVGRFTDPSSSVGLSWVDHTNGECSYEVQRTDSTGTARTIALLPRGVHTCRDTVPEPGAYTYRVRAVGDSGMSGYSAPKTIRLLYEPSVTVLAPHAGSIWRPGATQRIEWHTAFVSNIQIKYSLNGGDDWLLVTTAGSITTDHPSWGNFAWRVPDIEADSVLVRIEAYSNTRLGTTSPYFAIASASRAGRTETKNPAAIGAGMRFPTTLSVTGPIRFPAGLSAGPASTIALYRLDGALVAERPLPLQSHSHGFTWDPGVRGVYVLRIRSR